METMVHVHVVDDHGSTTGETDFNRLATEIILAVKPSLLKNPVDLNLVFVDDAQIQQLNKQYRQKDQPTDVLSFSYLNDQEEGPVGELVISRETLERQAGEQGHDKAVESRILFVHGLLHILGYDHEHPQERQEMLSLEKRFLGDKAGLIQRSLD